MKAKKPKKRRKGFEVESQSPPKKAKLRNLDDIPNLYERVQEAVIRRAAGDPTVTDDDIEKIEVLIKDKIDTCLDEKSLDKEENQMGIYSKKAMDNVRKYLSERQKQFKPKQFVFG